jgi:NADPH:quinone reductase-like Zn-dependent oxidoreductase
MIGTTPVTVVRDAAALPLVGLTTYQALFDHGEVFEKRAEDGARL